MTTPARGERLKELLFPGGVAVYDWEDIDTFTSCAEAIQRVIVEPIEGSGESAADYDIDGIAEKVLGDHADGYACLVGPEEFWTIVAAHRRLAVGDGQARRRLNWQVRQLVADAAQHTRWALEDLDDASELAGCADLLPEARQLLAQAVAVLDRFRAAATDRDTTAPTPSYATRDDAIQRLIVEPIEASGEVTDARATYDVEAIAAKVLGGYEQGYRCLVDADTFWRIVAEHNRRPVDSDIR